ncbi:hypothetical protein HMPREF0813_02059 [Streptococcus anginosus F0211]|uniref:Uncharacterized protein n=1 Tax=Streptococcus anginosus F0211 TaxID=706437 RepID=E6J456_STRAP|nr:hypothetical protein HMPREF0813_02059 [Streptococcus anginosus F0211]
MKDEIPVKALFLINLTQNETLQYKNLSFNTLFLQCFRILI